MKRDGLRAIATGQTSPMTNKPVFRIEDAEGNRVSDVHTQRTVEEALAAYRRGVALRTEAEANPQPPPPFFPPEPTPDPRRPLIRRVPPSDRPEYGDEPDDFLYHVTASWNVESILTCGLILGSGQTFTNYAGYSKGKAFLTERGGVRFWTARVRDHLAHAYDRPPGVVVLRLPRGAVSGLREDTVGSRDALAASYYVTEPIPQRLLAPEAYQGLRAQAEPASGDHDDPAP